MPNSTCDLASLRASANTGVADTVAAHAARSARRSIMSDIAHYTVLSTAFLTSRASRMPVLRPEMQCLFARSLPTIYETWSPVPSNVLYNRRRGRASRVSPRGGVGLFLHEAAPRR